MNVSDQFVLRTNLQAAWEALSDIPTVAACIPGMVIDEQTGPDSYAGSITVQFGPTKVVWRGVADFAQDPAEYVIRIDARGADGRKASRAHASLAIAVGETGPGADHVEGRISGDIDVSGALSSFANTGGAYVLRALLTDFEANLSSRLTLSETGEQVAAPAGSVNGLRLIRAAARGVLGGWLRRWRLRRRAVARRTGQEPT